MEYEHFREIEYQKFCGSTVRLFMETLVSIPGRLRKLKHRYYYFKDARVWEQLSLSIAIHGVRDLADSCYCLAEMFLIAMTFCLLMLPRNRLLRYVPVNE